MLELLSSLAARPGKSLLLSSHLLGDIERVCQYAIVLNAGRVVSVGLLNDLRTQLHRGYRLGWEGDAVGFVAALRHLGLEVLSNELMLNATVKVPDDFPTRTFFALAREHGVLLTSLEPEEENLEAIYHRVIRVPAMGGS
jgi:ABC-2 type transport system ATP-binding protein